ncbi:NUDIX hydrolase [Actinoplanes sp. N902-109]|uniref:nucleotide triphosphate diphosphatase NUDT15 n=1 Tax=Actinoplanes sp. (strain N902-109) TaxID=649831 RepID=UPI000329479F|nr:NUDIX domain-containing protein [Actinoplanes sp. N902-109]AGL18589.1 nudix hydrolase 1 [Actinoplanes sp. N902-109]
MADGLRPVVGVQAIVSARRDHRVVLLARRRNVFGDGQWGFPGGHLEFGESFEGAAQRELAEETGLIGQRMYVWKSVNTPYERSHYVQIGVQVPRFHGELRNREPDKCSELRWCRLDDLPAPLFAPSVPFLDALRDRDRMPVRGEAEPSLAIFLYCTAPPGHPERYVSYLAMGRPPRVFVRLGRWGERRERELRQYAVDSDDDVLDVLRADIARRLKDGYHLYDVRGSYSVEQVRSLFPAGAAAYRSVRGGPDPLSSDELALHTRLEHGFAQLSLFDPELTAAGGREGGVGPGGRDDVRPGGQQGGVGSGRDGSAGPGISVRARGGCR